MQTLMNEQTIQEQKVYDFYKQIEADNFHLKKQLLNAEKETKRLKHLVRVWKGKAEGTSGKNHFRKRGSKYDE